MKAGTPNHFKTQRLKRLLKIPVYQAVGILESLWQFAAGNCWDGNIGRIPDEDIVSAIEYDGDTQCLFDALLESELIDEDPNSRYRIHDWYDHAPDYVRKRIERKYGRPAADFVGQWPPLSAVVRRCPPLSDQRRVNHAQPRPCPTQPNQDTYSSEAKKETRNQVSSVLEFRTNGQPSVWHLTQSQIDRWQELYPTIDILAQCRGALAWIEATDPPRRKTSRGMKRFLVGWFGRATNNGHHLPTKPPDSASRVPTAEDLKNWTPYG